MQQCVVTGMIRARVSLKVKIRTRVRVRVKPRFPTPVPIPIPILKAVILNLTFIFVLSLVHLSCIFIPIADVIIVKTDKTITRKGDVNCIYLKKSNLKNIL